ncbi:MAG: cytochrome c [Ignavibacteriales bacterium]|nr:cytochrome c [Ignavibacteriales bacterium]
MKKFWKIFFTLIIICVLAILFLYSGIYNISALEPHNGLTLWVVSTLTDNSIEHNSKDIKAPDLSDSTLIKTGFIHYREMCVGCHGAPGIEHDEIGEGLYPRPPKLSEAVKDWKPSELFWITKNGIKMTGMPGFGTTHSDDKIWAIVSFIQILPNMTIEQYESFNKDAKNMGDE